MTCFVPWGQVGSNDYVRKPFNRAEASSARRPWPAPRGTWSTSHAATQCGFNRAEAGTEDGCAEASIWWTRREAVQRDRRTLSHAKPPP